MRKVKMLEQDCKEYFKCSLLMLPIFFYWMLKMMGICKIRFVYFVYNTNLNYLQTQGCNLTKNLYGYCNYIRSSKAIVFLLQQTQFAFITSVQFNNSLFHLLTIWQVELCKRVLNIYRHVVMNIELNHQTWSSIL